MQSIRSVLEGGPAADEQSEDSEIVSSDLISGDGEEVNGLAAEGPTNFSRRVLSIPPKHKVQHVNILVVGATGLGKSTFIQQLFIDCTKAYFEPRDGAKVSVEAFESEDGAAAVCTHVPDAVHTTNEEYEVYFHIQDTPGCTNDNVNQLKAAIIKHIRREKDTHYKLWLDRHRGRNASQPDALGADRQDRLFDVCVYFIPPHCFTSNDERFICDLNQEVPVIPVCAKADAMDVREREVFQAFVRERLALRLNFASIDEELRHASRAVGKAALHDAGYLPPFALVCSNTYRQISGIFEPVRGYPWGELHVSNLEHSDFNLVK
ncbi:hypothetical protein WJX73_001853 [Symbiochloris irregularis]|uniref:Septin-type G domain-containing protein n=1 Tax=Symbiochloris irregularis TaxID=706552 RepID=A0AAW1PUF1_9CHLO